MIICVFSRVLKTADWKTAYIQQRGSLTTNCVPFFALNQSKHKSITAAYIIFNLVTQQIN